MTTLELNGNQISETSAFSGLISPIYPLLDDLPSEMVPHGTTYRVRVTSIVASGVGGL